LHAWLVILRKSKLTGAEAKDVAVEGRQRNFGDCMDGWGLRSCRALSGSCGSRQRGQGPA
jgi:hypothetical protein